MAPGCHAALPEDAQRDALVFRERVQTKLHKLAADFNAGTINRAQFRDLYAHYQSQLQGIEQVIEAAQASDEWKGRIAEGAEPDDPAAAHRARAGLCHL